MLQILRVFLGVDAKLLPDSMSTEDFGKFIENQKGKLFGNPEDFKKLQQIISKKDSDFVKTKSALEKLKVNSKSKNKNPEESELEKTVKALKESLKSVNDKLDHSNKILELEGLQKSYPDILPELLVGKNEDEQKAVVEKQRSINKRLYGDSQQFTQPSYNDIDSVDKEIDDIKVDNSVSGEKSAVKIMQLGRVKDSINAAPDGSL